MKKIAFLFFLLCSPVFLPLTVQAARVEQRLVEQGRLPREQAPNATAQSRKQMRQARQTERKELRKQYRGGALFLGSVVWLISGIVLALFGLIMLFFGGIFTIFGASIGGLGLLMVLSYVIYKVVVGA